MSDEVAARLKLARGFLLAGGALSWETWCDMPAQDRAALVLAGEQLRREMAAMTGNAARSRAGAAEVIAPVDDGLEAESCRLEGLLEEGGR